MGPIKDENGELFYENAEKSQILNNHYSKVFTVKNSELPIKPVQVDCQEMAEVQFTQSKIVDVLKQLKNSSSPGPDRINQRILKEAAEEISFLLLLLFIKSMQTSKVPADWKIANVSPIFKKGSKFDPAKILSNLVD